MRLSQNVKVLPSDMTSGVTSEGNETRLGGRSSARKRPVNVTLGHRPRCGGREADTLSRIIKGRV